MHDPAYLLVTIELYHLLAGICVLLTVVFEMIAKRNDYGAVIVLPHSACVAHILQVRFRPSAVAAV
jgi:hypothetical protein